MIRRVKPEPLVRSDGEHISPTSHVDLRKPPKIKRTLRQRIRTWLHSTEKKK